MLSVLLVQEGSEASLNSRLSPDDHWQSKCPKRIAYSGGLELNSPVPWLSSNLRG